MSATKHRLKSIDVLRGIAVLAVVAIHIPHHPQGGWREHPFFFLAFLFDYGWLGVPLFVVISGFCIHLRAARQQLDARSFSWRSFWVRRFYRLYPPYVAAIAFSLFMTSLLHDRYDVRTAWPYDLLTHLLLIHNVTGYAGGLGNGAFWSLAMEEQLYMLYALLLLICTVWSWRAAILVVGATASLWGVVSSLTFPERMLGPVQVYAWPFQYWLYWALGAVAVDAYYGNIRLPRWCRSFKVASLLLVFGMVMRQEFAETLLETNIARRLVGVSPEAILNSTPMLIANQISTLFLFALAFFVVVNAALAYEGRGGFGSFASNGFSRLGQISYSLYLTHVPVIFALEEFMPLGYEPRPWLLRYCIYTPICLAVGWIFFVTIERWFLKAPAWILRENRLPATTSELPQPTQA